GRWVISGTPWFDPARFHRALGAQGCGWGEPLVAVPTTTSTNDLALTAERAGATEGAVYVAREQTQGRGRRGNPWWAAAGDNLTFSVLLRPRRPAAKVHSLPRVVGLAVRAVVAQRLGAAVAPRAPPVAVRGRHGGWVGARTLAAVRAEGRLRGEEVSA